MPSLGEGIFLSMTPETAERVWGIVEEMGHEKTSEGFLGAFMDMAEGRGDSDEEPETLQERMLRYAKENPHQVKAIRDVGVQTLASILSKIKR